MAVAAIRGAGSAIPRNWARCPRFSSSGAGLLSERGLRKCHRCLTMRWSGRESLWPRRPRNKLRARRRGMDAVPACSTRSLAVIGKPMGCGLRAGILAVRPRGRTRGASVEARNQRVVASCVVPRSCCELSPNLRSCCAMVPVRECRKRPMTANNAFETDAIAGAATLCQRAAQLDR